jgi:hypothetical protein
MRAAHILLGAALVAAGAMAAAWLPLGLMGSFALLALLRICWIEDNITSDLFGREALPTGYQQTMLNRRLFFMRWFGRDPSPTAAETSAHLMATALRAEAQVWGVLLLGFAAMLTAQHGPFAPMINLWLAVALLALALRHVDRLALSLAHCEAGRALPDHLLLPPGRRILAERKR